MKNIKQILKHTLMMLIHIFSVVVTCFATIYYSLIDLSIIDDQCTSCMYSPYIFLGTSVACFAINVYLVYRMNKRFKFVSIIEDK